MSRKLLKPTANGLIPRGALGDFLDFAYAVNHKKKWREFLRHLRALGYPVQSKKDFAVLFKKSQES